MFERRRYELPRYGGRRLSSSSRVPLVCSSVLYLRRRNLCRCPNTSLSEFSRAMNRRKANIMESDDKTPPVQCVRRVSWHFPAAIRLRFAQEIGSVEPSVRSIKVVGGSRVASSATFSFVGTHLQHFTVVFLQFGQTMSDNGLNDRGSE
ncbi:hypothetical protein EVAR_100633_1 [Eumeta japonica]|uniref:Uncharacterized protein n=1 Tax=Eumeta variegata TaxID=151549 RepID=A0A4C2A7G1_EUMVA|nr:hypothetical protein EVAR_100633_1 [Eumeta japonica]